MIIYVTQRPLHRAGTMIYIALFPPFSFPDSLLHTFNLRSMFDEWMNKRAIIIKSFL